MRRRAWIARNSAAIKAVLLLTCRTSALSDLAHSGVSAQPAISSQESGISAAHQQTSAALGCRIQHRFKSIGLGSSMRGFLENVLLPAVRQGLPPGSIEIDEFSFWYSCSPSSGWSCYFDPAPPSPAALRAPAGTSAVQRKCNLQDLQQLSRPQSNWHNASLLDRVKLDEARAAMRPLWSYSNSTRSWLQSTLHDRLHHRSKAGMLLSVHLRRGDKIGEEWQNNFTFTSIRLVAQRIRDEVARAQLSLGKARVHIMSDDIKAAGELYSRLKLPADAVVIMRPESAAPATGFSVCLSPQRFGTGACECKLSDFKSRIRHDPHWAAHCLVHGKLITAPLTYDQVRDEMHGILFDLEVARRATLFVGACNSNTGHLVQLLRTQSPETSVCLDTPPGHMFKGVCKERDCDVRPSISAALY